jgi:hypothetical protein
MNNFAQKNICAEIYHILILLIHQTINIFSYQYDREFIKT